jgi:hypothetical protein
MKTVTIILVVSIIAYIVLSMLEKREEKKKGRTTLSAKLMALELKRVNRNNSKYF